ncbi:alpha/beta hydrolase [Aquisphaera insulae]|uniref:alpha/beta hydrolase n=1 Tax=Aquisphaera insulae TaxID=2712864 RepID=UPI0013EE005B|nr:alpha/beta hydrolase [Aquisphaera insulae]
MSRRRWLAVGVVAGVIGLAAIVQARQPPPPESVDFAPDIVYGTVGGETLHLDLARPKRGAGPFPLIVCIHGGGWQAGNKAEFRQAIFSLAEQGFAAASLEYRFAPRHRFPAQYDDVKEAVRFLRDRAKEWNLDAGRVAAFGGSAGGHLALLLATDPEVRLRAAVSAAGPTDLSRPFPEFAARLVRDLIGPPPADPVAFRRSIDPIDRLGPHVAPLLLIHGDRDEIVPYEQSVLLHEACKRAGLSSELITIPGGGHGGGGRKEDQDAAIIRAVNFLRDHLK